METKLTIAQQDLVFGRLMAMWANKMCEANELNNLEELTEIQERRLAELESQLSEAIDIVSKLITAERELVVTKVGYYTNQIERFGRPGDN